ncbi:MAG TPA: cysteine rich repeat-containing protein [Bradyrhizobium sp.]
MYRFFLAISLLSISVSTGAFAQDSRGTPNEQKACSRDVQRHCRAVIDQGDLGVLGCLQQHRPKISLACDQVLRNHGQ